LGSYQGEKTTRLRPNTGWGHSGRRCYEFGIFVEEGQFVSKWVAVAFAVTSKVKYIDTPQAGVISNLNRAVIDDPAIFQEDPYGRAWIFSLGLSGPANLSEHFWDTVPYYQRLLRSEACGNPQGLKVIGLLPPAKQFTAASGARN